MTAPNRALGGNHARGVACLLAAIGLLGLMEVGVKTLTESLLVGQILWARFFFHLVAAWPIFMMLGVRSVAHGLEPRLEFFDTRDEQAAWLVGFLKEALRQGESLRGTCVVARTRTERNVIADELTGADLPVEMLEADSPDEASSGVRLATMHRVKGLEFDCMVIASVNEEFLPLATAVPDNDGPARTAAEIAERALVYVAATRAKKELVLLSFGAPSPFLN